MASAEHHVTKPPERLGVTPKTRPGRSTGAPGVNALPGSSAWATETVRSDELPRQLTAATWTDQTGTPACVRFCGLSLLGRLSWVNSLRSALPMKSTERNVSGETFTVSSTAASLLGRAAAAAVDD